jgi:hypothetical protein
MAVPSSMSCLRYVSSMARRWVKETAAVPPSPVETGNGSRGGAARGRRGTGSAECPGPVRDGHGAKGGRRMGESGERERLLATAGAWRRRAPAPSPPASRRHRAISVQPAGCFD